LTEQPQQQPQQKPEEQKGDILAIPMKQIQEAAKKYMDYRGMINAIGPLLGFKMPKEIDTMLVTLAQGGDVNPEQIQQMINNNQMPMTQGVPVGQPVMTFKMAKDAWLMHNDGMGTREIAEEFTAQGSPVSHATVARWINEYDELMQSNHFFKFRAILKTVGLSVGFIIAVLAVHVILNFFHIL